MLYRFISGTNGILSDPTNWQPDGGPPGANDVAVIRSAGDLYGSLSVDTLWFPRTNPNGQIHGDQIYGSLTATTTRVVGEIVTLETGASLTTGKLLINANGLEASTAGSADPNAPPITINTSSTLIKSEGKGFARYPNGSLTAYNTVWNNTGGVFVSAGSTTGGTQGGGLGFDDHSVVTIGKDLRIDTAGNQIAYVELFESTMSIGHDLVVGSGADFEYYAGSALDVGHKLTLLAGSTFTIGAGGYVLNPDLAVIHAGTVELAASATFIGTGTITGPGADNTTIFNRGVIEPSDSLIIKGNIYDQGGTIDMRANSVLTVDGGMWGQSIEFKGGGHLSAEYFGGDTTISGFAYGDILSVADIASISYDHASHVLSLEQSGGGIERFHIKGNLNGEHFVLGSNGNITLAS